MTNYVLPLVFILLIWLQFSSFHTRNPQVKENFYFWHWLFWHRKLLEQIFKETVREIDFCVWSSKRGFIFCCMFSNRWSGFATNSEICNVTPKLCTVEWLRWSVDRHHKGPMISALISDCFFTARSVIIVLITKLSYFQDTLG